MKRRQARCACGQLSLECVGEPVRVSICHCLECQRRTGSVFSVQARFPLEDVRFEGRARDFTRRADSGNLVRLHFCPGCGSTVYWQIEGMEDFVVVAVGAFSDPGFPEPTISVFSERSHPWALFRLGPEADE